jgi:peptidoglycan/xylan/chitin deacetylase (PgdA/CDA1 family)
MTGRTGRGLALTGLAAWVAYAWLPHLATFGSIRRGAQTQRRIALTFDDGPHPRWTPRVLDVLARQGVRASFFLVGQRAQRAPDVVRAIAADGHEIDNHSWSHRSLWLCGPGRTRSEIVRGHEMLAALVNRPPRFFRPPWGMVNAAMPAALRACRERLIFWSIQPEGLRPVEAAVQVDRVLRRARPGAIVDLHDAEGTSGAPDRLLDALPGMIDGLRAAGYCFASVGELLEAEAPAADSQDVRG